MAAERICWLNSKQYLLLNSGTTPLQVNYDLSITTCFMHHVWLLWISVFTFLVMRFSATNSFQVELTVLLWLCRHFQRMARRVCSSFDAPNCQFTVFLRLSRPQTLAQRMICISRRCWCRFQSASPSASPPRQWLCHPRPIYCRIRQTRRHTQVLSHPQRDFPLRIGFTNTQRGTNTSIFHVSHH